MDGYGDPIPPGHGETDGATALLSAGSDVYDDDAWDALLDAPLSCPLCTGDLIPMGSLGTRAWFRCRACGLDQSHVLPYDQETEQEF